MTTLSSFPRSGRRSAAVICAFTALLVGLICAAAALSAGLGYRSGLWPLGDGFLILRYAVFGALAGAVLALLAWALTRRARGAPGRTLAILALALNIVVALPPLYLYAQAQRLPKIHDISTDTRDPPVFVAVLPLRQGARNPVDYLADTAVQQRLGYPDIVSLPLAVPPAEAFARAEQAARAMGWQIVAVAPEALRIEATDSTLFFGFKDDIVVRVRAQAQGSLVDVRSLSRIGGSDIGANAQRVRRYLKRLAAA
ncbi:MAG: DUF1499 domain-containing protein [Pseudomonadota bacterium]